VLPHLKVRRLATSNAFMGTAGLESIFEKLSEEASPASESDLG
jgi:hypothetical protein